MGTRRRRTIKCDYWIGVVPPFDAAETKCNEKNARRNRVEYAGEGRAQNWLKKQPEI